MRSLARSLAFAATIAALAGCSKTAEPDAQNSASFVPPTVTPGAPSAPPAPAIPAGALAWDVPTTWNLAPNPSPMRKATYRIPKAAGDSEDAEVSVSEAGGGVDANLKRWSAQFEGAPGLDVTHRDVGGLKVTIAKGNGTFTGGGMPGSPSDPKKDWALLGAMVESPTYFFKLTGPEKTVQAAAADFDKLVGSLRKK